jgi:hypothetical protein
VQRRKSGYKAAFPLLFNPSADGATAEEPQKAFLRERFKARCFARAKKDREKARRRTRRASVGSISGGSSDGDGDFEMEDEDEDAEKEEEDEDAAMQDELFRRIMANLSRKQRHTYRLSYAHDVGSSVDPDMEDIGRWEAELRENEHLNITPQDFEDEELQAYAEEHAALADFDDLEALEWSLSDLDDWDASSADRPPAPAPAEDGMDMS